MWKGQLWSAQIFLSPTPVSALISPHITLQPWKAESSQVSFYTRGGLKPSLDWSVTGTLWGRGGRNCAIQVFSLEIPSVRAISFCDFRCVQNMVSLSKLSFCSSPTPLLSVAPLSFMTFGYSCKPCSHWALPGIEQLLLSNLFNSCFYFNTAIFFWKCFSLLALSNSQEV